MVKWTLINAVSVIHMLCVISQTEEVHNCAASHPGSPATARFVNCSNLGLHTPPHVPHDVVILDLSKNELENVTCLRKYQFLEHVTLSDNRLTHVVIPPLPHLHSVDLSRNSIAAVEDVSVSGKSVKVLNLSGNCMTTLHNLIFQEHPVLRTLRLSDNQIKSIGELWSSSLVELHLSNTSLHYVKHKSFVGLKHLRILFLNRNRHLATLNRTGDLLLKELTFLDVSRCDLTEVEIRQLPNLTFVNMSHNRIFQISDDAFNSSVNLSTIDLSFNRISRIASNAFRLKNLLEIDLSHNHIVELNWTLPLRALRSFNLSFNEITDISHLKLSTVEVVHLSHNKIHTLPRDLDSLLPHLKTLILRSNRIRNIKRISSSFLEELDLSSCGILVIAENALQDLSLLKRLDLSDNKLKDVQLVLSLARLEVLKVNDNTWDCKCDMFHNVSVAVLQAVQCFPKSLPWDQYCTILEEEELQSDWELFASGNVEADILPPGRDPSKLALGWIVGGSVLLTCFVVAPLAWTIFMRTKKVHHSNNCRSRDKSQTTIDLLEPTKGLEQPYHYAYKYVTPPLEEVELRRSCEDSTRRTIQFYFVENMSLQSCHSSLNDLRQSHSK